MDFFRKYSWEIIIGVIIFLLFIFTRFYNILSLPIFTDEAIYIRWAQIAKGDASWRFISLTDGKQPLFIWLTMVAMRFVNEPLLAGRLISVGAGLASMFGLFFLGKELFKNYWIGLLSSFLYLIFPFALVYDKMALYDSLVGTFAIWSFYFEVLLVRRLRLDVALVLALVIGGGVLNKTSGFFNIYLLPFSLLLLDFKNQKFRKNLLKWIFFASAAAALSYLYYLVLRLSPFFHIIRDKNSIFVYQFNEWLTHPLEFFWGNISVGQWNWVYTYLTWPVLFLIAIAFFIDKKFLREKLLLFIWFLVPFVTLALFGRTLYPRFIFFMTLFLLPLAAFTLWSAFKLISNKFIFLAISLVAISFMLYSDYFLLSDFGSAPIPDSDSEQYNNSWPSGTGVKESVFFFEEKAKNGKIYIATEGTFGLMPYSLEIYLGNNPNIEIKGYWPIKDNIPQELIEISKKKPVYFVFYQSCPPCTRFAEAPPLWGLKEVLKVQRRNGDSFFTVYKINPK